MDSYAIPCTTLPFPEMHQQDYLDRMYTLGMFKRFTRHEIAATYPEPRLYSLLDDATQKRRDYYAPGPKFMKENL